MRAKKTIHLASIMLTSFLVLAFSAEATADIPENECLAPYNKFTPITYSPTESAIAKQLGWVESNENHCGGFYLEQPFLYPENMVQSSHILLTSNQGVFSFHGTSSSKGQVTITYNGKQITANEAYLHRDPKTGKFITVDLLKNVRLREPNNMVVAQHGHFDFRTRAVSLLDILYRTPIYSNITKKPPLPNAVEFKCTHKITQLSAWGEAKEFSQTRPKIYDFANVTYTTCPPEAPIWQVKAEKLNLNKITGRGTARNARLYVKNIPIFYSPYLNFPIDSRRQTGFLTPTFSGASREGFSVGFPFYWNLAPNYDTTLTPIYSAKRKFMITDLFRYLTPRSFGDVRTGLVPNDPEFRRFQKTQQANFENSPSPIVQANLNRLENASTTRYAFAWQNNFTPNEHWTTSIDYSRVSDDYYLRDFYTNLNEVTQNQLLQQAEANYRGENWTFSTRLQGYQTLHPVDKITTFQNQYIRLPQLRLEGDYPDQAFGLEYTIINDLTHFDIQHMPGENDKFPIGNRFYIQPGVNLPLNWTYFYFNPRLQFSFTHYELGHVMNQRQKDINRGLPIFDIHSGFYFDRNILFCNHGYRQTLEPQFYYTYVPFRGQNNIPLFDTALNTLTYDQLFTYNRFTSIDRIGDANQLSYGVTTRFIDNQSGIEKLRAGVGQILYFRNRVVTLCENGQCDNAPSCKNGSCNDNPQSPSNREPVSPLSGVLNYYLTPSWSLTSNSIWDPNYARFNNQTVGIQYRPDLKHIVNLNYSFVRLGNTMIKNINTFDLKHSKQKDLNSDNLTQTDLSFIWPIVRDWSAFGRWTQNWGSNQLQNLIYGLQYDGCCWAMRFVAGRTFTNLSNNNNHTPKYDTEFLLQVALKGLGASPSKADNLLTNSIPGYENNFGQDF